MFVLQGEFDRRDFLIRTLGEIGNGAVLNLAMLAIGFAQQNTCIDLIARADFTGVEIHRVHLS